MKVGSDKYIRSIAINKEDWEYLSWIAPYLGKKAGGLVRDIVHEMVGRMRLYVPMGANEPDVIMFARLAMADLSKALKEVGGMLGNGKGMERHGRTD